MAKMNLTPIKDNNINRQQAPVTFMAGGFGSRGTAMLRAALSEKQRCLEGNISLNNTSNNNGSPAQNGNGVCVSPSRLATKERARLIEEHRRTKLQQLRNSPDSNDDSLAAEEQNSLNSSQKKRSPKNKVLFSKPVVTKQFEYEQTILVESSDHQQYRNGSSPAQHKSPNSDDCDRLTSASRKLQSRRIKSSQTKTAANAPASADCVPAIEGGGVLSVLQQNLPTIHDYGDENNDDDDELYIMAPSSFQEVVETPKISKKRPHEDDSSNGATDGYNKVTSTAELHLNYDDGGLFHSPKVAKIAPYYHDQSGSISSNLDHQADVKSATPDSPANTTIKQKLRSQQSKTVQQRLCYPISENYSITSQVESPEHPTANKNENANGQNQDVTLESLINNKNNSNNIDATTDKIPDQEPTEHPTTAATAAAFASDWNDESMSSQQTYFNWISNKLNFLSNKMNKLIF